MSYWRDYVTAKWNSPETCLHVHCTVIVFLPIPVQEQIHPEADGEGASERSGGSPNSGFQRQGAQTTRAA